MVVPARLIAERCIAERFLKHGALSPGCAISAL